LGLRNPKKERKKERTFDGRAMAKELTFVADSDHQIMCKWTRRTRINNAVWIVHMSGNLAPASCGCSWMHRRKPPTQIEALLFELAKKILWAKGDF